MWAFFTEKLILETKKRCLVHIEGLPHHIMCLARRFSKKIWGKTGSIRGWLHIGILHRQILHLTKIAVKIDKNALFSV